MRYQRITGSLRQIWRLGVLLCCVGFTGRLFAHDPGLSVSTARLQPEGLNVHLAMSPTDVGYLVPLDANHDGIISPEELVAAQSRLQEAALKAFEVEQDDRVITATNAVVQMDNTGAIQFHTFYPGALAGRLTVRSKILGALAHGHRQFLSIRDQNDKLLGEQMLDVSHDSFAVSLSTQAPAAVQHSFREFLMLGIMHIATGYDHILFLLGLLIVGGSFRSALKIITAFTVAHSITLALATMNIINIPPRIIEPLIAVSIIYVGIENIFRHQMKNRWMIAFAFGLIHGCGFASALRDLGIGSDGTSIIVPLFSFNLGVELCQMTIAAIVLPIIWKLRQSPQFVQRFVPIGSCMVALAGTWWLLQRTILS